VEDEPVSLDRLRPHLLGPDRRTRFRALGGFGSRDAFVWAAAKKNQALTKAGGRQAGAADVVKMVGITAQRSV
jgi:hypothetical protein